MLRLFLRDQWRAMFFFLLGLGLVFLTIWLAARLPGGGISTADFAYALGLGVLSLTAYLFVEYVVRRPFYVEARARLRAEVKPLDAQTFRTAGTAEQRLFLQLLHHYAAAFQQELATLQERHAFYELFTTRFAHQMKTPLTVIQLLEEQLRAVVDGHSQALLDSLAEERGRLDSALGIMLHTARLKSFSFDARMEQLDLTAVLRDVVNEHKAQWIRRRMYPRIEAPGAVVVRSDRKWISFVADQIVRNALQYGRPQDADRDAPFAIGVRETGEGTVVTFRDQGIGIPARDLRRVFEPFFTGSNGRDFSRATGMGLYLVRQVADRLGCRVTIESQEGQGTTVTLTIPAAAYLAPALSNVTEV